MSELLQHQDIVDDAFHEIQLSGKQLVFLFMATTIVAVVIFLCGVQVGRGVKAAPADTAETIAAAVPQATRTAQPAATPTDAPAVEPPSPAKESAEDLSYAKRLQSDAQPQEKVKPHVDAQPPASAPVASAPPPSAPALTASAHKDVPAPATAQAATPKAAPTAAPASGRPGVWVVQVQALKAQSAAAALAQRLVSKGYPAFVLSPVSGAPSIYRVQVGRFNDRREAEQIARRLEKEEQFKPWISH